MVRIGFLWRFVAVLIDVVVIIVPVLIGNFAILAVFAPRPAAIVSGLFGVAVDAVLVALTVLYAATPGKMALGLKIRDQAGLPAPKASLALRGTYLWLTVSTISFLGTLLNTPIFGYLGGVLGLIIFIGCFLALRPDRLALQDILFKTAVYGPPSKGGAPVETRGFDVVRPADPAGPTTPAI